MTGPAEHCAGKRAVLGGIVSAVWYQSKRSGFVIQDGRLVQGPKAKRPGVNPALLDNLQA